MFEDSWINGKCTDKDDLTVFLGFFFSGTVTIVTEVIPGSGHSHGALSHVCCHGGYR